MKSYTKNKNIKEIIGTIKFKYQFKKYNHGYEKQLYKLKYLLDIAKVYVKSLNKNYISVPHMGIRITNKCSLNCKNCADVIPYLPNRSHVSLGELKKDIHIILNSLDYIYEFMIIGGETFLHPQLNEIIDFCVNSRKIGYIILTTNGTILPNEKLLKSLSNPKVIVRISDYDSKIAPKRSLIIKKMRERNIKVHELKHQRWGYLGSFEFRNRTESKMKYIYENCGMKSCHTITNGEILICGRQNAATAKLVPEIKQNESFYIRGKSKDVVRKGVIDLYNLEYLSTCSYCNGLNTLNLKIKPAEQIENL